MILGGWFEVFTRYIRLKSGLIGCGVTPVHGEINRILSSNVDDGLPGPSPKGGFAWNPIVRLVIRVSGRYCVSKAGLIAAFFDRRGCIFSTPAISAAIIV